MPEHDDGLPFSADLLAELRRWSAILRDQKRMSPKTVEAYRRDVTQFLDAKQIVPIVVFGAKRHPSFSDVPASSEFGHDIDLPNWRALVTSVKVPKERLAALSVALDKIMQSDEWKKFCAQTYTCITKLDPTASRHFVQKNFDDAASFLKESGTKIK